MPPPPGPNVTKTTMFPAEMKDVPPLFETAQVVEPPGDIVLPAVAGPQSELVILAGKGAKKGPVPVSALVGPVIKTLMGRLKTLAADAGLNAMFRPMLVGATPAGGSVNVLGVTVISGTPTRNIGFTLTTDPPGGVPMMATELSVPGCVGWATAMQKLTGKYGEAMGNVSTPPLYEPPCGVPQPE